MDCNEAELFWRCTTYGGSEHVTAPGALYVFGDNLEDQLLLDQSLIRVDYTIFEVDIEGATSPKTTVAQALSYDTFVSVAQEQDFLVQTANAQEIPVIVKTYYDDG